MSRTTYYINDEFHDMIKEEARKRKVPGKVVMNDALEKYFKEDISNKEVVQKIKELLEK